MTQTLKIDMGEFIRKTTAQLDRYGNQHPCRLVALHTEKGIILMRSDWLNNILRMSNDFFYKAYGGWTLEIDVDSNPLFHKYTGRIAFVPACPDGSSGL